MESFTKEMVSNGSAQLFPEITLGSSTKILPEQLNLEGQWEVAISEISYPSMYQNVMEGKFLFIDKKLSKMSKLYYPEPWRVEKVQDSCKECGKTDSEKTVG